jgi:integrase
LLNNSSKYLHQIISISLFTGLRINELLNLKWVNVDFDNDVMRILNTDTFQTKTRRDRVIPLNSFLKSYLKELKNNFVDPNTDLITPRSESQMEYVICGKYGEKIGCVRKAYKRLLVRLGIEGVSLHTLRHTFASVCIMNYVDLYTIKEFLGHSRVTTTEIYTHISQEFKWSSIERLTDAIR